MKPLAERNGRRQPDPIELPDEPAVLPEIELPDDLPGTSGSKAPGATINGTQDPSFINFESRDQHAPDDRPPPLGAPEDPSRHEGANQDPPPPTPETPDNEILDALADAGFEIALFQHSNRSGK